MSATNQSSVQIQATNTSTETRETQMAKTSNTSTETRQTQMAKTSKKKHLNYDDNCGFINDEKVKT